MIGSCKLRNFNWYDLNVVPYQIYLENKIIIQQFAFHKKKNFKIANLIEKLLLNV